MARIGAQVSLFRYVYPKYSAVILVNNRFYYHPVIIYKIMSDHVTLYNKTRIGNLSFEAYRDHEKISIIYENKLRWVCVSQFLNMTIQITYREKWNKTQSYGFFFTKQELPDVVELRYLINNIPDGYLFEIYNIILRLINEINASGKLREKLTGRVI
jgi:hypothetical protein